MKQVDLSPLDRAWDSFVKLVQPLFAEHAFLTIVCAFLVVLMTLSFYRFLKSISPGLVAFIFVLMFGILILHWTFTRTEPSFLKPAIDVIAPFFPSAPQFPEHDKSKDKPKLPASAPTKSAPTKAAPAPAKPATSPAKV